jgi:hypothetical protein
LSSAIACPSKILSNFVSNINLMRAKQKCSLRVTGELAYICGGRGKPLTKESFGNIFKDACVEAGVHGKSAHGLRKIGATRAANNGARSTSLRRYSAGRAAGWHRSTPAPPTAPGSVNAPPKSYSRTIWQLLFPHLTER